MAGKMKVTSVFDLSKEGHGLALFGNDEIKSFEETIFEKNKKPYIKCFISGVEKRLTPEEVVRQLFARRLVFHYGYPKERIAVEKATYFGSTISEKRADIVV